MRLLLDTHLLLWAAARSERLPREARELLEDDDNEVYYSAASIWEIAIKSALGRKDFRIDLAQILPALALWKLLNTITNFTPDNRANHNSIGRSERRPCEHLY